MIETLALITAMGAGLVVISLLSSMISFRAGVPLLLVFLLVGLLAGEDGIGGIPFDSAEAAYFVGSVALAVILFDSGFGTSIKSFRTAAAPAVTLATVGVAATAAVLAVPAHYLLGLPWLEAMLLGAIVGSTDAAAVFFLLRVGNIRIRERVRATLEVESGSNDPMAIFLVITLLEVLLAPESGGGGLLGQFVLAFLQQMGLGALLGLGVGWLLVRLLNRFPLESGMYPVMVLALALLLYAGTTAAGGSGFLAVYLAGLVMGNLRFRGGTTLRRFQEGLTWLAQITMFLVLGLLATPSEFHAIAWQGVLLGLLLILVARPLAVWLCLLPFGFTRAETTFIAWVGLRGAVSILLAILPIMMWIDAGQLLFNTAFIVVLVSLVVQGWTIRPMARWLGLIVPPRYGAVERIDLELPGQADHELLVYRIVPGSPVAEGERIPRWARPSLIIRHGQSMRVHEAGRPQVGDYLYLFATPRVAELLDRLFAEPAHLSSKDQRYFGEFAIAPDQPVADLAMVYGLALPDAAADMTVGRWMQHRLGGRAGRGDRVLWQRIELVVRDADAQGMPTAIGLTLEPSPESNRRLPIFQNAREMTAALRDRWHRWRAQRDGHAD